MSCILKYINPEQSDYEIDTDSNKITHTYTGRIWTKRIVNGSLYLLTISAVVAFILLSTEIVQLNQYSIVLHQTVCCLSAAASLVIFVFAMNYTFYLFLARSDKHLETTLPTITDVHALD